MLQEMIGQGQRVERFVIEARTGGQADGPWQPVAEATTIGYKRLLRFPPATASRVRVRILDSRDCPTISRFGLFKASPREEGAKNSG
jgi:alpha-L-fucosidase